jgi:hypothetical protein
VGRLSLEKPRGEAVHSCAFVARRSQAVGIDLCSYSLGQFDKFDHVLPWLWSSAGLWPLSW